MLCQGSSTCALFPERQSSLFCTLCYCYITITLWRCSLKLQHPNINMNEHVGQIRTNNTARCKPVAAEDGYTSHSIWHSLSKSRPYSLDAFTWKRDVKQMQSPGYPPSHRSGKIISRGEETAHTHSPLHLVRANTNWVNSHRIRLTVTWFEVTRSG